MRKANIFLIFIAFVFQFIIEINSYVSSQPTWLTSPYFRAGNDKVISTMTGNNSMPTYTFTFSSALSGIPNLAYGIKNYRGNDTLLSQMFEIRRVNLTASTFKVSMQIFGFTNIFVLTVPYLAIDPTFPHHLNSFDNVPLNYSSGPLTNLSVESSLATYHTQYINYTSQSSANKYKNFTTPLTSNKIVLFVSSFYVIGSGTTTSFNPCQMDINYTILNSSHYKWTARIYQNASVTKIHFSQIVYNQDDVMASKTYMIVNQEWTVDATGGFQSFPQQLTDNMILALTDFHSINGRCGFQYNWQFVTNYSGTPFGIKINASLPTNYNCGFNYARSTLFYIKTWQCGVPYVYYNLTTDLCQDGCGNYYYTNTSVKTCDKCYYACISCSTGSSASACTTCQTGTHRTLTNSSCVCDSGYFDDGYASSCRACSTVDSHCLTCSYVLESSKGTSYYQTLFSQTNQTILLSSILPNFTCFSCITNYFLNGSGLCQTCSINYCITCLNITACSTCNTSALAVKYTNNLCYLCNLSNCIMCSADNYCSSCTSGYSAVSGTCQSCGSNCSCGGYYTPKVGGVCSTHCGDGYLVGTKQCDDNNTNDHDGCSSTCTNQTCNVSCLCDGWKSPWTNGSCTPICGDNLLRGIQQCDDGNLIDHDGCSSTCTTQVCSVSCLCDGWTNPFVNGSCTSICGDGLVRGTQQCDDHNLLNHDGCSSTCTTQACNVSCLCDGWTAPFVNGFCTSVCGDGLVRGSQQCDDHNIANHDGCSSICTTETCNISCSCDGWQLPWSSNSCTPICGDNLLRGSEQCDDGNLLDHDGCSSTCTTQTCNLSCLCDGWQLPWSSSSCTPICGDSLLRGNQQCDDGNLLDHDGCSSTCITQTCSVSCLCDGWQLPWNGSSCTPICGDSLIRGNQQCDDGNLIDHDGCSSTCTTEVCNISCLCDGWTNPFVSGSCTSICGDSLIRGIQQCDDGNLIDHDGCSSTCITQVCNVSCLCDGWMSPFVNGSCTSVCGDNLVRGGEQCDDGNLIDNDGCSSSCTTQACNVSCLCDGWTAPFFNVSCTPVCGDGLIRGSQQCDDHNLANHDGCSSTCTTEACNVSCSCDGWQLPWSNSSCTPICGDSLLRGNQQCDDGNLFDHDGCSSTCTTQSCNLSCLCDGWQLPWNGSSCTSICGDSLLRGNQQCDDGNALDHDGCSSSCLVQACNVSCLCDGWKLPFTNGSCTPICGDGLIRGTQQCDDHNFINQDGCDQNCLSQQILPIIVTQEPRYLLQQSSSNYTSLILFGFGFKIVGMEMLNVFQNFQLLLQSQNATQLQFSYNIHGYSESSSFPFNVPDSSHIFSHFNHMFLIVLIAFSFSICLQVCQMFCKAKNNQVTNIDSNNSLKEHKDLQEDKNQHSSQQNNQYISQQANDFAVHIKNTNKNNKKYKNDQTRFTNNFSLDNSIIINQSQTPKSCLSVLFRQIVFDLLINVQYIFVYSLIKQLIDDGLGSIINFGSLVTVGCMFGLLAFMMILCSYESSLFGENQLKFHNGMWMFYWGLVVSERIIFSSLLSWNHSFNLFAIIGLKFVIIIVYLSKQIYFEKVQQRRCLVIHLLHFALLSIFIFNQKYLKSQSFMMKMPYFIIQYVYLGILASIFCITVAYYVRQIMYTCKADYRHQNQEQLLLITQSNGALSAIFDAKVQQILQDSSHPFHSPLESCKTKNQNIFDQLKSKNSKINTSLLQIPDGKSYGKAKSKKLITTKHISKNQDNEDLRASIYSKQSYQTHKRSHQNQNTKKFTFGHNVFDQDEYVQKMEESRQTNNEMQDPGIIRTDQEEVKYKQTSLHKQLQQQSQAQNKPSNNLNSVKTKKNFMRSMRRFAVKNKNKRQQNPDQQNQSKKYSNTHQDQSPDKGSVLGQSKVLKSQINVYNQPKRQMKFRTYYKKAMMNVVNSKQINKNSNPTQEQQQASDNYDAVSIRFE